MKCFLKDLPNAKNLLLKAGLILFGIAAALFFIELGLSMGSGAFRLRRAMANRLQPADGTGFVILCLGESTTDHQYPQFLEQWLNTHQQRLRFRVVDEGHVATNTTVILSRLDDYLQKYRPDMVVSMMGVNDRGTIVPWDPEEKGLLAHLRVYRLLQLLKQRYRARHARIEAPPERTFDKSVYYGSGTPEEILAMKVSAELNVVRETEPPDARRLSGLYRQETVKHPGNIYFVRELANVLLRDRYREEEGERLMKMVLDQKKDDALSYYYLGKYYVETGRLDQAEKLLLTGIEAAPGYRELYEQLAICYRKAGKTQQALALGRRMADCKLLFAGTLARSVGDRRLAKLCHQEETEQALTHCNLSTTMNYLTLFQKLKSKGIQLVAVQYPLRSVKPLKKMLPFEEIIFVDNERSFQHHVDNGRYDEYFIDQFAGDFGHCTKRGNQLLAENIGAVILKELGL